MIPDHLLTPPAEMSDSELGAVIGKQMDERLYDSYRYDRDHGISHAQIVADGVYGAEVESYCMRFDLAVAQYVDAMNRREPSRPDLDWGPDGSPLKAGT